MADQKRVLTIRPSSVALWSGVFAGPFAFALVFELKYALVGYACRNRAQWLFWIFFLLGLAICAYGALSAWRGIQCHPERERGAWAGVRRDDRGLGAPPAPPGPSLTLGVTDRARFMAHAGLVLSIGFAIFIVALMVPDLFLRPCQ